MLEIYALLFLDHKLTIHENVKRSISIYINGLCLCYDYTELHVVLSVYMTLKASGLK